MFNVLRADCYLQRNIMPLGKWTGISIWMDYFLSWVFALQKFNYQTL